MDPPLPQGYDCDTINSDALTARAKVTEEGSLILPEDQSYRYLVLDQAGRWQKPSQRMFVPSSSENDTSAKCPDTGSGKPLVIRPGTLHRINELVEAGATVIGPKPVRSPGLGNSVRNNEEIKQLGDALWGETSTDSGARRIGKGRVIWGKTLKEVMAGDGVAPDLEIMESPETKSLGQETFSGIPSPSTFDWIHRKVDGADVYFIANLRNAEAEGLFTFRVNGKQPEFWDAVSGEIVDAVAFRKTVDRRTAVPIKFAPRGSMFVVFRKKLAARRIIAETNFPALSEIMQIGGPWRVMFDPAWGGPALVVFDELEDWSKRDEQGIKYYSGRATYLKTFDLPEKLDKGKQWIYLNLGKVYEIAAVRLNGKNLGAVWTAPWQVEMTGVVRAKGNRLEIEVANLWTNRLVGDVALTPEERLTVTNVTSYKKDSPLLPSGLMGPVRILITN